MTKVRNETLSNAHAVLNSFRCIVKSLRLADRAGLKEYGVGSSQLYVLHELKRTAPLSINELAERTATDQSTVSVVVAKLIEKGLVSRVRSPHDARRAELALTAKGRQTVRGLRIHPTQQGGAQVGKPAHRSSSGRSQAPSASTKNGRSATASAGSSGP